MSENLQQVFIDFVNKAKDQLASVDQKYPSDDEFKEECLKYVEKLEIYKNFTERLIEEGTRHLSVISHLNEELSKPDLDGTSTTSSVTIADEKYSEDFEFLRKCVDKRANLEEEAMNSLAHLESVVEMLVADKQKLINENLEMKAQKSNENITSNAIATLTKENEELKEIIKRNKKVMNLVPDESCDAAPQTTVNGTIDDNVPNNLSDCLEKLEALRRQLNDKDKVISRLTNQLSTKLKSKDDVTTTIPHSSSSESSESQPVQPSQSKKHHQRSRSDVSKASSLTDNEKSDNEKLRLFKDAYKEMALILKEKYQQLREYRAKITELMKRLEESESEKEEEILELKDISANLKNKNNELTEHVSKLQDDPKIVDELKQKSESLTIEIEQMKEREMLLARKLAMQESHIVVLRDERKHFIKMNNELFNSIAVCKKELAKFNVNV